ncbi:MAG: hypothetical protein JEZ01_02090 [Labilibaculum sp.]|nr:hypothetical protein [Labilibaculum sp.]
MLHGFASSHRSLACSVQLFDKSDSIFYILLEENSSSDTKRVVFIEENKLSRPELLILGEGKTVFDAKTPTLFKFTIGSYTTSTNTK